MKRGLHQSRGPAQAGVTLLEMLVAMAIFAIITSLLYGTFSRTESTRRYVEQPGLVMPSLEIGSKAGAIGSLLRTLLTRVPDLDRWEQERGHPVLNNPLLAHDSKEWRAQVAIA